MVKIHKHKSLLLLEYEPDGGTHWIYEKLGDSSICIKKTFNFEKNAVYNIGEDEDYKEDRVIFVLGYLEKEYYKLDRDVLFLDIDVYIHSSIEINDRMFTSYRNISIFRKINKVVFEDIYIGGERENLPYSIFLKLINSFPNKTELDKYTDARIGGILRDYFSKTEDSVAKYERYINRVTPTSNKENELIDLFSKHEYEKYKLILKTLKEMLENEINYSEKQW